MPRLLKLTHKREAIAVVGRQQTHARDQVLQVRRRTVLDIGKIAAELTGMRGRLQMVGFPRRMGAYY